MFSCLLALLRRCYSLEELVLSCIFLHIDNEAQPDTVHLPNLHLLTLNLGSIESGTSLGCLILPTSLNLRLLTADSYTQLPASALPFTHNQNLTNVLVDYHTSSVVSTIKAVSTGKVPEFGTATSEQRTGSSFLFNYRSFVCNETTARASDDDGGPLRDPQAHYSPLAANISLPSLNVFRFVDSTIPAIVRRKPDAYQLWVENTLKRLPRVGDMERKCDAVSGAEQPYLPELVQKLTFYHVQLPKEAVIDSDMYSDLDDDDSPELEPEFVALDVTHLGLAR